MAKFSTNLIRFEDVRQAVVDYLSENNQYNGDFDFDGSNIGYFIDVMAYYTMLQSYQNTLISNNIFIDTTEIRKNAISIAKSMGYRPKRKVSSRFSGSIEYYGDSSADTPQVFVTGDSITIPARTLFTSGSYTFINKIPITLTYQNNVLLSGDFVAYEGSFNSVTTFGTGEKYQSYVVESNDVEDDSLNVYIRETNTASTEDVQWTQADSFFNTSDDLIFFVEEDLVNEYRPRIVFGDGVIGQIPTINETITIEYLETSGDSANNQTTLSFSGEPSITVTKGAGSTFTYSYSNLVIDLPDNQVSYGGKDNEDLEGIQFNAPRFYTAAGRGVTVDDLKVLLSDYDSTFKYYNVVGGNSLYPGDDTKLGITYITGVPYINEDDLFLLNESVYLSVVEENGILSDLFIKTVAGTIRRFIKPTYIYIEVNPYIEVPSSYTNDEAQSVISASYTNVTDYRDTYLKGLGESFRTTKLISQINNTNGVISSNLDVTHYFSISSGTFYVSKETVLNLPVLYKKDATGSIIYDTDSNPLKEAFVKNRGDIIVDINKTSTIQYTQFTLPIEYSSIYGALRHKNSNRYLYNIDVSRVEIITFQEESVSGSDYISYTAKTVTDNDGTEWVSNLYENGGDSWQIQLNGRNIAQVRKNASGSYYIHQPDRTFLEDTMDVVSETIDDEIVYLRLNETSETNELGNTETYYSVSALLSNVSYSDVRIYGETKLGDAAFDPTTFSWTWSNTKTLLDENNDNVTFSPLGATAADEENFLTVVYFDASTATLLSVKHDKGTFSLNNFNEEYLTEFDQRNDFKFDANYTSSRNDISLTDEAWQANKSYIFENTILTSEGYIVECTTAGDSGSSEPSWPTTYTYGDTITDGDVTWTLISDTADINNKYISYEISSYGVSSSNEQILTLNAVKSTSLVLDNTDFDNTEVASTGIGRLTAKWFHLYSANNQKHYYVWFKNSIHEKSTFTCIADVGGALDGDYVNFETVPLTGSNSSYYVWYNVDGLSTDPAPVGEIGIEVVIATGDSAETVATATKTAVDLSGIDVTITRSTAQLEFENDYPGEVTSALSVNSTGFTSLTRNAIGVDAIDPAPDDVLNETWYNIPVVIRTGDGYATVADKMATAIDTYSEFTSTDDASGTVTISFVSNGKATVIDGDMTSTADVFLYKTIFGSDYSSLTSPYNRSYTGFTFTTDTVAGQRYGGYNADVDLNRITANDLLVVSGSTDSLNNGTFLVKEVGTTIRYDLYSSTGTLKQRDVGADCVATGTDVIKTKTVPDGTITIYNKNGIEVLDGQGTILHYNVDSGTYGSYSVYMHDLFHDVTVGQLSYADGLLTFEQEVKGYIDYETNSTDSEDTKGYYSNQYITSRSISGVFDNYGYSGTWDTATNKLDIIKIVPVDDYSNTNVFLGQSNDFDTLFNQCLQINITTPIIKK